MKKRNSARDSSIARLRAKLDPSRGSAILRTGNGAPFAIDSTVAPVSSVEALSMTTHSHRGVSGNVQRE